MPRTIKGAVAGRRVYHRGYGTEAVVRNVEHWPDGSVRGVWVRYFDGSGHFLVAAGCWRQFWRPVRREVTPC